MSAAMVHHLEEGGSRFIQSSEGSTLVTNNRYAYTIQNSDGDSQMIFKNSILNRKWGE